MSNIYRAFENGKAFIPFITCGDPDLDTTERVVLEAVKNGADLIELGIPFSDPTAEGPVIQGANVRALRGGATTDRIFSLVRRIRQHTDTPMVFMTYANVVFSYGPDRFIGSCRDMGIDGLILPDLPYEEKGECEAIAAAHNVDVISMIAPTSESRIRAIASEAKGFLYVVSSMGVTGVRSEIKTDLGSILSAIRKVTDIPAAVGFGINTPEQAAEIAAICDGVIVGSAIVRIAAKYGSKAGPHIYEYVRKMKEAIALI